MKRKNKVSKIQHSIGSLGIEVVGTGEIRVERLELRTNPRVPFPHRHDFFQVCFITRGCGWHEIDFKRYTVKPRKLFVMKPAQVHAWEMSADATGFILEFGLASLRASQFSSLDISQLIQAAPDELLVSSKLNATLVALFSLMLEEFSTKQRYYELTLQSCLSWFAILVGRDSKVAVPLPKPSDVTAKFAALVETHFREDHRVEFYAEKLGISAKALTMRLARSLKRSPREVIQDRFLLEAKRLLLLSDLSVSEISVELGVEDANYFSRLFRSKFGVTPTEFRARHQSAEAAGV